MRIGIVAPSVYAMPGHVRHVQALVDAEYPDAELIWHPQVFGRSPNEDGETGFVISNMETVPDPARHGHFAGSEGQRIAAFVEFANRPDIDAIWFARGGYGSGRIALDILPQLGPQARRKTYMGYSDASYLLGLLYRAGFPHVCHGPMVVDMGQQGTGTEPVRRALNWLVRRDPTSLEPGLRPGERYAAFNLISAAMMVGTPLMPDLTDHVLMVEEVGEYLYAVDRCFFAITMALMRNPPAEIRLGEVTDIKENDRPFGTDEVGIARYWCDKTGIRYGGRAAIGHSRTNHIVPFGRFQGV
jgi:muramoyltetrapeptide carboxypeptidase